MLMTLLRFDEDVARRAAREPCVCGGSRNAANFRRSPRGFPPTASADVRRLVSLRFSFCCSRCRRRFTPPSLRFHGRAWYLAPVRLLASVRDKECRQSTRELRRRMGISLRTISRWRRWWNQTFRASLAWSALLGLLRPGTHDGHLPDTMIGSCLPAARPSSATNGGADCNPWVVVLRKQAPYLDGGTFYLRGIPKVSASYARAQSLADHMSRPGFPGEN